jgi:sialic acid synthase SpsE
MVQGIRNIEQALGDGVKRPSNSESRNLGVIRKSIVANQSIQAGDEFTNLNLATKRPGTGLSPMLWDSIMGTKAKRDFEPDDLIEL